MASWLPKEILDHLEHAGYVAVPKECIREFYAEAISDDYSMRVLTRAADEIACHIRRQLCQQIGLELGKEGFLSHHLDEAKDLLPPAWRHRVSVHVIRPR